MIELEAIMADLLSLSVAGTTVKTTKITDIASARERLTTALEEQARYWAQFDETEDTASIDFEGKKTARSLWFKKMATSNNYMFKVLLGNIAIYPNDAARKSKKSWFINIPKEKMGEYLANSIDSIRDGSWDAIIQPSLDEFLKNQQKMADGKTTAAARRAND